MNLDAIIEAFESFGGAKVMGLAAMLLVGWWVIRRLLARPAEHPHLRQGRCESCGWKGQVSRYKPACPKCGGRVTAR